MPWNYPEESIQQRRISLQRGLMGKNASFNTELA
jgi:hypothetical protein